MVRQLTEKYFNQLSHVTDYDINIIIVNMIVVS